MRNQINKQAVAMTIIGMATLYAGEAAASASFVSNATVNFSVANITSASGDLSGLEMTGSFMRSGDGFPFVYTAIAGEARVIDDNPEITETTSALHVGDAFSHSFALDGLVLDGAIDFNQVAWYDLGFVNHGSESLDVTLDFSYELSTEIAGQGGTTGVRIEYWDWADPETVTLAGIDATTEIPDAFEGYASNIAQITFTLDQNSPSKAFGINVNHTGFLEAAPVPLPAAVWPFLTGLMGIAGLGKRKRLVAQAA